MNANQLVLPAVAFVAMVVLLKKLSSPSPKLPLAYKPTKRTIADLEELAKKTLPNYIYYYFSFRAGSVTQAASKAAYDRLRITSTVMVDVTAASAALELFGKKVASPVMIAPSAFHILAHPDGEKATALAAKASGSVYAFNFMYSTVVAETIAGIDGVRWLHTYLFKNRDQVKYSLQRAQELGFSAVVVTCDHPHDRVRNHTMPCFGRDGDHAFLQRVMRFPNVEAYWASKGRVFGPDDAVGENDPSITWKDIAWIKANCSLPLVCKGVLSVEDALLAVGHGADGIVVSNHGNRQTDSSPPAIEILPQIAKAFREKSLNCKIFIDSGIETGAQVFKALALGADAVLIGRPVIWGLSAGGAQGVQEVLDNLKDDLLYHMKSAGCISLKDIGPHKLC